MTPQELFELALSYYNGTDNIPQDYLKAYDLFLEAAEAGHIGSQSYLGRMLSMGEGVEKDYSTAVKWLKLAADAGDADAQNRLGIRYEGGQGVEQNYIEAARLFQLSAEQGHSKAQVNLAVLYKDGKGVEQDYLKAFNLLQKADGKSAPLAHFYLGVFFLHGYGTPIDYNLAFENFTQIAELGDPDVLYNIAYMYRNGLGRKIDIPEAIKWYKQAAEHGAYDALSIIGDIYKDGEGVPQDYSEALKWYMRAADVGDANAQCFIGYFYDNGLGGLPIDYHQAFNWYLKASEGGDEVATFNLGVLYSSGKGVDQDNSIAFQYYMRAADMGYAPAFREIGIMYECGEAVEKDLEKAKEWFIKAYENGCLDAANDVGYLEKGETAVEWFKKGIENGDIDAQYNLGRLYHQGVGIPIDYPEAFKWYTLAAENNFPNAFNNLGVMYAKGEGTEVSFLKAKECYQKAIDNGGNYSVTNIANLWFQGQGIEKNISEAIRIFHRGYQEYNNIFSLIYLSNIYLFGIGISKDYRLAASILKKLYRYGIDLVCYNLGCAYYNGYGVAQNKELAKFYWNKVKEYDSDAMSALTSEGTIKFRFMDTKIEEGAPFFAEKALMFQNHDEAYIDMCLNRFKAGDTDALFNMIRTLVRSERRDILKEDSYFNHLIKIGYPQAVFLDAIYSNRQSICDIDFNTPFYVDEIIESQYENPTEDELLSVIFLIYTILKGYDIDSLPNEHLTSILYSTYMNTMADESQRIKIEKIRKLCSHRETTQLIEEYQEYVLDILEGAHHGTTTYPNRHIVDIIHNQLSEDCFNKTYDLLGGAVKYALLPNSGKHHLYVKNQRNYNLLNLIIDISGRTDVYLYNQQRPTKTEADIIIAFPELRKHNTQGFDVAGEQINVLKYIISQSSSYRFAVLLVDREFCSCVNNEMYEVRKQLFVHHFINKIVELPKGTFNDVDVPTALLFMDFTSSANEIKFISGESIIVASYACLEANDYCLNSKLYNQPLLLLDNHKEYRLCDLIQINRSSEFYAETAYSVEDSAYSASLLYALQSRTLLHQKKNQINTYKGPHIILRYDNEVKLYIHREEDVISCGTDAYAIKVDTDKVEIDYMAYILLDKMISEYLSEIVDGKGLFMPRDLLYRKVSIPIDKAIQKQIVEEAMVKERQMSGSGVEYNVILLSKQSESLEKQLNEKGINIFQRISSVNADECTFEDIFEQYIEDPSKVMVDAIIIDSNIEDYEDVLFYFRTIRERNIQIYILGDKYEIRIAGSKLKEYFLKENRVFDQAADGYLDKLLNKMRDDLDSSNAPQAKIRNKYKAVFEAADALDKKYPDIGVSKAVLRYIQTGCNIEDVDNVSGPCGSFRNVCHKLLQVFVSKKLVPDIDPGAIPAMLKDGRFYDGKTQRTYILKEQFMSKYLSRALEYFCKVTNEGVHGSQDSSRLGTAALNILMEFIVWFYENDICSNKLDEIPVNPCYEDITDKLPSLKGKVCTVKAQGAGKDRYLYADNIHIKENKILKPGMKIKIKEVGAEMIAEDDRRKIDDEYMVFYTSSYDIL